MRKTIQEMDWEELLPEPLKRDARIYAMAKAIGAQKRKIAGEIWRARVWLEIERMPEEILDALAYDMDVRWYSGDYDLALKRKVMGSACMVYRTLGTAGAVKQAIGDVYEKAEIQEWFQYGGAPYHFRLLIDQKFEGTDPERHQQALERVNFYKNVRSQLDGVEYIARPDGTAIAHAGLCAAGIGMKIEQEVHGYGLE